MVARPSLVALRDALVAARRDVEKAQAQWLATRAGTQDEEEAAWRLSVLLKAEARACNAYIDALADMKVKP